MLALIKHDALIVEALDPLFCRRFTSSAKRHWKQFIQKKGARESERDAADSRPVRKALVIGWNDEAGDNRDLVCRLVAR